MNSFGTNLMAASNGSVSFGIQMLILVGFIILMYFLLVRPQKKREKSINEMRNALKVGDEVVTIGGICGKIVKTKENSLVLQVGADKVKFEVMRWAISSVTSKSKKSDVSTGTAEDSNDEDRSRKSSPRRLKKSSTEEKKEAPKAEAKEEAPEENK